MQLFKKALLNFLFAEAIVTSKSIKVLLKTLSHNNKHCCSSSPVLTSYMPFQLSACVLVVIIVVKPLCFLWVYCIFKICFFLNDAPAIQFLKTSDVFQTFCMCIGSYYCDKMPLFPLATLFIYMCFLRFKHVTAWFGDVIIWPEYLKRAAHSPRTNAVSCYISDQKSTDQKPDQKSTVNIGRRMKLILLLSTVVCLAVANWWDCKLCP